MADQNNKGDKSEFEQTEKETRVTPLLTSAGDGNDHGPPADGQDQDNLSNVPIDRGWAWVIVAASFGMHVLVVGAMKSFGVLFVELRDKYHVGARDLGLVQGIVTTLMLGLGLAANMLAVRFTSQKVVFAGGILTTLGFVLSAFIPRFEFLYLTYSIITGLGFALSYSPCVVMVGIHFKKRRSLANGISVSGSGVGSFILPNMMRWMLNEYGLSGCLLLLGGLMLNVCVCAMLLRPISSYTRNQSKEMKLHKNTNVKDAEYKQREQDKQIDCDTGMSYYSSRKVANITQSEQEQTVELLPKTDTDLQKTELPEFASNGDITSLQNIPHGKIKSMAAGLRCLTSKNKATSTRIMKGPRLFDWSLLSNPVFLIYAASCGLANLAFPNIFFMLPAFAESNGQDRDSAALLLSIIGITDLAGRLFFGWCSDLTCLPRRFGFVGGLAVSGTLNLLAPAMTSFAGLATYAAVYGFFAGSFFALISVMLAEALGVEKLSSSYGLATLAMSVGLLPGPLICGEIQDVTSSWDLAFAFCGIVTLMASLPPLFEPCAKRFVETKIERTSRVDKAI